MIHFSRLDARARRPRSTSSHMTYARMHSTVIAVCIVCILATSVVDWWDKLTRFPIALIPPLLTSKPGNMSNDGSDCKGYGKLILFGEHFVVYKAPAIVGAVSAATTCHCELLPDDGTTSGLLVVDHRPAIPGYKVTKQAEANEALNLVLDHFGIDTAKRGVKLTFGGDLCAVSGIGASACGIGIDVLQTGVTDRFAIFFLVMTSIPQTVENKWVSIPSAAAAFAMIKLG